MFDGNSFDDAPNYSLSFKIKLAATAAIVGIGFMLASTGVNPMIFLAAAGAVLGVAVIRNAQVNKEILKRDETHASEHCLSKSADKTMSKDMPEVMLKNSKNTATLAKKSWATSIQPEEVDDSSIAR